MKKEIVINAGENETRIAITEDGRLAELFVETANKEKMVGDIYLGKVAKVMPGIKAAFIDLGLKQDGFLHFSDIGNRFEEYSSMIGDDDDDEAEEPVAVAEAATGQKSPSSSESPRSSGNGQRRQRDSHRPQRRDVNLSKGQEIIVQITKEPVGKKGVRVTSEVSLAGRFIVLLPFDGKVGISKKITSFKEKRRLRKIAQSLLPEGFGVIIRTVAEGQDDEALKKDLSDLIDKWREIESQVKSETAPSLVYKDLATTSGVIRDLFSNDVSRVIVDSKRLYKEIAAYVKYNSPDMLEKIELHKGRQPIFDTYGIEKEIETTLSRKVWLKSGGYLIIEQTEAMFVIDINSGRYAAKKEQEQNSLRTDLEAAREICRQLRLRDIGGIIVCDFIDLEDEKNKRKVYEELKKEFRKDRAKVTVLPMTEFGLVQITRQRIRQSILHSFTEACPACGGSGVVQSRTTTTNQLERWIRRFKEETGEYRLILRVNPSIASMLREGRISRLTKMMLKFRVYMKLEIDPTIPPGDFHCLSVKQGKEVTDQFK
ncbi:MAG: Rne/Rng family ribonuclease [Bacteroidetes bacterium]|nr:Rne/Rng family ribonuclease [Bacteroidota bacterium]MCW5894045.1 Rne/Rng family ribonuclease [Bacteroidota bacterium]